jgi:thiol-disulfide isomerase/thioredoxin
MCALPGRADDDAAGPKAEPEEAAGLAVGTVAPAFTLPVVNEFAGGKKWGPAKWTGVEASEPKKLVVLSFFASYCEPCKKELPELARLYDAYKDQGLGVMVVSIDKGAEMRNAVAAIAMSANATFPVLHDRFQLVARKYAAERLPYMLLLGPDGAIQVVHVGYTDELKAGLENELRGRLGLEPLPPPKPAGKGPAGKPSLEGPKEKATNAVQKTKAVKKAVP